MTATYFDTSALVPLVIGEPSTDASRKVWATSERRLSSVIAKAELAAALAKARRMGRIDEDARDAALAAAQPLWADCDLVSVSDRVADAAAMLASRHDLRGYDALHVTSSLLVAGDVVCVSSDQAMIGSRRTLGLPTVNLASAQS